MAGRTSSLTIDYTNLMAAGVADCGLSEADLERWASRAADAVRDTAERRRKREVGFLDLPDDKSQVKTALEFARGLPSAIDTVVVLGIGGSSLGPHALYSALARPLDPVRPRAPGLPRRLLFPDNADPDTFSAVLELCPPERTLWNVVTKSGSTAETAAQLLVVFDRLAGALGAEGARRHVVVTTDPSKGPLRRLAERLGLTAFPIPPSVGGRFSVLSPVGLLPAACAGLDITGLVEGARAMRDRVLEPDLRQNPALFLATALAAHHQDRGRPMVVVMPYADRLFDTADWFRQLWAESLGKANDVEGKPVHVGPTPIASRGATDQHSQLQLYAEGPDDKTYLFVAPRERAHLELPKSEPAVAEPEDYGYLAGRDMGALLDAELRGTIASLTRRGRPNAHIALERVEAAALGELLMLFMAATAYAGPLYRVNPFDQPGVEEAKQLAYAALGRTGFEHLSAHLAAARDPDPRYRF
ncbi:MAG TPA: glucose-6-phosphate isomerase [Kofleriaceae bacterium]|nr:glucose-6-phosphate isomerase [Kofleriaceae bacterium]